MRASLVKSLRLLGKKADVRRSRPLISEAVCGGGRLPSFRLVATRLPIPTDPSRLSLARRCRVRAILTPTPIRVASAGEHHILYAHEAQERRLGTGFLLQPRAVCRPIPSTNASTPAVPDVRGAGCVYARSTAPAGTIPCSL